MIIARHLRTIAAVLMSILLATSPATAASRDERQVSVQFDRIISDAKALMLVDPTQTITKAKRAEQVADAFGGRRRSIAIATAKWLQGEAYSRLNDIDRARPLIDSGLANIGNGGLPSKLYGDLLLSRAGINTTQANVAAALADYQKAHNIFRDLKETRSQTIALISMAFLYQEASDFQNALKYYRQASEVYNVDPQMLLTIYNNTAGCFLEMGRHADAEAKYREALIWRAASRRRWRRCKCCATSPVCS